MTKFYNKKNAKKTHFLPKCVQKCCISGIDSVFFALPSQIDGLDHPPAYDQQYQHQQRPKAPANELIISAAHVHLFRDFNGVGYRIAHLLFHHSITPAVTVHDRVTLYYVALYGLSHVYNN